MANVKTGLDYYTHEIGMTRDKKLSPIRMKYGSVGVDVWLTLLDMIYADKGYYIGYGTADEKEAVIWEILGCIRGRYAPTSETVAEIIERLVACGLFSGDLFDLGILSSRRIQEQFYLATVERKAVEVNPEWWLLDIEKMKKLSSRNTILHFFENQPILTQNQPNLNDNQPNLKHSIVKNSIVEDSIVEYSADSTDKSVPPRTRARFTTPTLEEVKAYCDERKNGVDPQRFIDYYSSNGWKVGKNPMKDWKAAVRTWEKNGYDSGKKQSAPQVTNSSLGKFGEAWDELADSFDPWAELEQMNGREVGK